MSGPTDRWDGVYDQEDYGDHFDQPAGDGEAPGLAPPTGPRRHSRPRSGHPVLKVLAAVVVLILVILGGGLIWAHGQIDPGGRRGAAVSVVIPAGSSTSQIGQRLASAGIVHNAWLFTVYVHLGGYGPLLAGSYTLQKNEPYSAAIKALRAGPKIVTDKLLVPEGFTVAQIAQAVAALPNLKLSAQKFLAAADDGTVRSPYEPAGINNLEGLLFPATYQVRQGESETQILEEMVGAFDDRAQTIGLAPAASRLGLTPYQLITVASIVEREAKLASDRPNVASTIYNRLRVGMTLGADSTQTYYLRLSNPALAQATPAQLDKPSPYNTRTNKGLPPTPIANPGLASLQAAASPASTQYLYFVEINPDGQLGFATNNTGFEHLRQQCQAAGLC